MLAQFGRHGIQALIVSAIDAQDLSSSDRRLWLSRNLVWNPMTSGQIACFLSHRNVWARILEAGEPWAFVCEDDLHLAEDFLAFVTSSSWLPADADIVRAETDCLSGEFSFRGERVFGRKVRRAKSDLIGSAGYFLSLQAARRLLALSDQICEPVDCLLFFSRGSVPAPVKTYQLDPAICIQDCHLVGEPGRIGFPTQISPQMPIKREYARPLKPAGIAKVWREIRRPVLQARTFIRPHWLRLTHQSVFKVIPFRQSVSNAGS